MPYILFYDKVVLVPGMCERGKMWQSKRETRWLEAHAKVCEQCSEWFESIDSGRWRGWAIPVVDGAYDETMRRVDQTGDMGTDAIYGVHQACGHLSRLAEEVLDV